MKQDILARPRTLIVGLLVMMTLVFSPPSMAGKPNCNGNGGQDIVVHLKRHIEDLQGAITAVRLAALMQSRQCDVTLFLTLGGVRLADDRMPQNLKFGRDDIDPPPPTLEEARDAFWMRVERLQYARPVLTKSILQLPTLFPEQRL